MKYYTITITEINKAKVDVEADSYEAALKMVEDDYWRNPLNYVLEPEDTFIE